MSTFRYPKKRERPVVETALMRDAETRTMAIHNTSPIVVWTGRSRLGKTTTAEWLEGRINGAYKDSDPDAFHAHHYQVTELGDWSTVNKAAMQAFHTAVLGPLDTGLYRRLNADDLAALIAESLKSRRIEVVFVDEAGLYSLPALRGLVAIRDQAVKLGHTLTLVLIGMDDLPFKLEANPQIAGRVQEWVYFQPHSVSETFDLLQEVSSLWTGASLDTPETRAEIEFVHKTTGGVAGLIISFVGKVEAELEKGDRPLSRAFLKAVHLRTQRAKARAQNAARKGYRISAGNSGSTNAPQAGATGSRGVQNRSTK